MHGQCNLDFRQMNAALTQLRQGPAFKADEIRPWNTSSGDRDVI